MGNDIIVTGAAGFVGCHVAAGLARAGFRVIATDISNPTFAGLQMLDDAGVVAFRQGDLTEPGFVDELLSSACGIVHGAGASRVSTARANPAAAAHSTLQATTQLLSGMASASISWFMLLSSREVERLEQQPPASLNDLYAVMKLNAEQLARCFCQDAGIPLQICRLSDVYGSLHDHTGKLLPIFIDNALQGRPLTVRDRHSLFYFTHVNDVVTAIASGIDMLRARPQPVMIRQFWKNDGHTAESLALLIRELVGESVEILLQDENAAAAAQAATVTDYNTGFVQQIDLHSGLQQLLAEAQQARAAGQTQPLSAFHKSR
ncbi:MAG: NAD(P)-dependent oxidoreductase [Chromatiales bacterium]|jgi:UDP-glucose 4-epimerase